MAATGVFLSREPQLGAALTAAGAALLLASLVALGGLLEGKAWAPWLEAGRLAALVAGIAVVAL
jgi:hypothetical protein